MAFTGPNSCVLRIKSIRSLLSPSELKVANYILEHPRRVLHSTITKLSKECGASEATIVRFCKNLGYDGYKAFVINIAQELGALVPEATQEEPKKGTVAQLAQDIFGKNMRAIQATLESLDLSQVEKAIDVLAGANRVEFFGAGLSNVVAMDAHYKFLRIGVSGTFDSNAHMQSISASLLSPGDVAVGISYSGTTQDVIDALSLAKESGATTICITNFGDMPIAEVSDIVICIKADEALFQGGVMVSRSAQIAVTDLLYAGVLRKRPQRLVDNFEKTKRALLVKLKRRQA